MRVSRRVIAACCLSLICAMQGTAAELVVNGDFESDTEGFAVWPGYSGDQGNPEITGWTANGGHGINPISSAHESPAPFRDNGDNDTHVAFLQGASGIEQNVSGFTVGQDYIFALDFNSRNCCGDLPLGIIYVDGNVIGNSADLFPAPGGVIPASLANGDEWYHAEIELTATATSHLLRIEAAPAAGGDATLLVDNVSLQAVPEPASIVMLLVGLVGLVARRRR